MDVLHARRLESPSLRFDAALSSQVDDQAYRGLMRYGPFDNGRVELNTGGILFVFPSACAELARDLLRALRGQHQRFAGFERMFRVPLRNEHVADLQFEADLDSPLAAATSYRENIERWTQNAPEPQLAFVLIPQSDRWETERPYYTAKAAFARLGVPTQMVTTRLIENPREFEWSVANIALAAFAKLGGIPWTVRADAATAKDLVLGVGRADVRGADGARRIFGYAVSFVANGIYRSVWSFTPAADVATYLDRLEEATLGALVEPRDVDEPHERVVVHFTKRTSWREIEAVQRAITRSKRPVQTAYLRIDDSSLHDIADGSVDTCGPPKGLQVSLSSRELLLQTEAVGPHGAPDGPLLVALDERSTCDTDGLDELGVQAFHLAHANWRGFNARAQPVTLAYGTQLAKLVGYLEAVAAWDPSALRSELRDRPWFL